ncbi:prephenate dehydrogenase [Chiua virens]|nr:prephenate dehydrogenase [Chiua virens]
MSFPVDVTPNHPIDQQPTIGLIGMGAMGAMYAKHLSDAGWKKISVCDLPEKYESLKQSYKDVPGVTVHKDGHSVSRISDFIMYSVEAEYINRVVQQYGPCMYFLSKRTTACQSLTTLPLSLATKVGAVVSGQTSVKAPEKAAFEEHLPGDVHIVSIHSLHGPSVSPASQPFVRVWLPFRSCLLPTHDASIPVNQVIMQYRASDESVRLVENIFKCFKSRYVYLSYEEHDLVTANVQAVTHAAFLTMGTAWAARRSYPWEQGHYVGGIETVKVNIMLRIYANKWHVYAGLAILNPSAKVQIDTYASSATELFKLMLAGDHDSLRQRVYAAREKVFGLREDEEGGKTIVFLTEDILDQFTISGSPKRGQSSPCNSHLSLLAMVDCWARSSIQPFDHLAVAATPVFRMWIGVAEYLFRSVERLDTALHAATHDVSHRSDDLEFVVAARGWSQCIAFGNFELYKDRFSRTAAFFEPRFEEANKIGGAMIKAISETGTNPVTN